VSPKKTAISVQHVCRYFPPTVFATHLPTLSSNSFCDAFADFFLQQISLSNWKLGQCVPQEDSNLYATCLPLFSSNSFCDAFADFILHQFLRHICRLYPPTDLLIQLEYRTMCPPKKTTISTIEMLYGPSRDPKG